MKKITFGSFKLPTKAHEKDKESNNDGGFGTFGSFGGKNNPSARPMEEEAQDTETQEMSSVMGFSGFGKTAKQFDINEMVKAAQKTAKERNIAKTVGKGLTQSTVWIVLWFLVCPSKLNATFFRYWCKEFDIGSSSR